MTSIQFKNNIVELVVKNIFPLSVFCKPAMQGLLGEMAKKLKVKIDSNSVQCLVIQKAEEEKLVLKSY